MRKHQLRNNKISRPVTLDGTFRRRGQAGTGGVQVIPSSNLNDPFGPLTENLAMHSENLNNWMGHWVKAPVTSGIPDPFGGNRAQRVQGNVNRVDGNGVTQYDTGFVSLAGNRAYHLTPGQTYTIKVWLRSTRGTQRIAISSNDTGGQTVTINPVWQQYTVTVVHPYAFTQMDRIMQLRKLDANNPDWEVAFAQVYRGTVNRIYAPTTTEPVVAGGLQNLITISDTFNTNWATTLGTTRTTGVTDPSGGTTAVRLDFAGAQANECLNHTGVINAVAGRSYTVSAWVRLPAGSTAPTSGNIYLGLYGSSSDPEKPFTNTFAYLRTTNVTSVWQRIVTPPVLATTSGRMYAQFRSDNYAWALEVWGVQVEDADPAAPAPRPLLTNRTGAPLTDAPRRLTREIGPATSFGLESGGTNLLLNSNTFSANWNPSALSAQGASAYSPDGTKNGVKLIPTTASTPTMLSQANSGLAVSAAGLVTCHFKQAEYRYARLCLHVSNGTSTTYPWAVFDLQTGTVFAARAVDASIFTALRTRVVALPNGWYRCAMQVQPATGFSINRAEIGVAGAAGEEFSAHDGVGGIYAWGAQLEALPVGYNLDLGHRLPAYAPDNAPRTPDLVTVQPGVMDGNDRTWLLASRRDSAPEVAIRRAPDGGGLESMREMQFSHNMESNTVFVERSGSLVSPGMSAWNGKAMKLTSRGVFGYQFGKLVYSEPLGRPYTSPYTSYTGSALMLGGIRQSSQWFNMWQGEVAAQLDLRATEDGDIADWSNNVRTALIAAGETVPAAWKLQTAISSTHLNDMRMSVLTTPRTFGYDTLSPAVLSEPSRTNMLSRSELMDTWTFSPASITVHGSTLTTNADGVAERRMDFTRDVSGSDFRIYPAGYGTMFTVDKTKTYTFSVEFKIEASASQCEFYLYGSALDTQSSSQMRVFNTAADNSVAYPATTGVTVTRTALADGWVRYVAVISPAYWAAYPGSGNSAAIWTGTSWSTLGRYTLSYRKFQFEEGRGATSYIPTTGTARTRTADRLYFPGLIETYPGVVGVSGINYVSRSEDFTTAWNRAYCNVTSTTAAAPNGKPVATEITLTGSGALGHTIAHVFDSSVPPLTDNETVTLSFYAKAGTCSVVAVELPKRTPGYGGATFNLTNGTFNQVATDATARMTSVGGGWYRCEVTRALGAGAGGRTAMLYFGAYGSYAGEGQTVYLYGVQLEPGNVARSYRRTTGAPALEGSQNRWTIALAAYQLADTQNQQHLLSIGVEAGNSPDASHALEIRGGAGYNCTFNVNAANQNIGVNLYRSHTFGNSTFLLGKWTTLFMTFDGTTVRAYLNGALVWTVTDFNFTTPPTHAILGSQLNQDKQFCGLLAPGALGLDIPFVDPTRAWTDAEITAAHGRWTPELAKIKLPVI
ncbi:hypothetical protein IHN63_00195 [Deinococcus sp. 6YEL10]|uniref:phage head spike fiber domain-containing protein n=1 Tax=Deinococcus sp. 6YEL10 TaxID=2745870 RepID=UPI001E5AC96D|nr:LamG-like jellyroll fold domain-containing protein [Deinococcus sp. 6YEL10]MCD0159718.1 hypothetical protein [Deinococcus sp. 6YEL10]